MYWYILSLTSLSLFSISSILQRKLLAKTTLNPVIYGFAFQVLVGIMAIPIFFVRQGIVTKNIDIWTFILVASVFYAISNLLFFLGVKILEISQVSIVGSTKSLWVLLGSAIILGEGISLQKAAGVFLIILALILIFWRGKNLQPSKGHLFILGAAIFSAAAYVVDGLILRNFSASLYLVISSLATGMGTLAFSPKSINEIHQLLDKKFIPSIILISFIFTVAVYLLYYSYQAGGTISSIIPITQSASILTILMAVIFLKETSRLPQKITAAILSLIGIYLLK
jgi:drug/metabolite transporter (DMT)-like permease